MIACLTVPYFAAAVERRSDTRLDQRPLALGGKAWEARPAYAFSQEVARHGARPGMSLRLVNVLSPDSHFLPAARPLYTQVSAEIVDVLMDFADGVEPQALWHAAANPDMHRSAHGRPLPARYCLDLADLSLEEARRFVAEMGKQVRRQTRLAPAIGVAPDKFTAQVAATVARPDHLLPVAEGAQAQFLSTRSISFLALDKETGRRLHLLGIRTLGQLASLPLPALRAQFGPAIEPAYRNACGQAVDRLQAHPRPQAETQDRWFEEPVGDSQVLAAVLTRLADDLAGRLEAAAMQARTVSLILEDERGGAREQTVTLPSPAAAAGPLVDAALSLLQVLQPDSGVSGITLTLTDLLPAAARQLPLFPEEGAPAQLQRALEDLAARYKNGRFYQPSLVKTSHPLPERRFQLAPLFDDPALA